MATPAIGQAQPPTDQELVSRIGTGDQEAFAVLYERHFPALYDFAVRMAQDEDVAADVVQKTFVQAWESLQRRSTVSNLKAWLFTVARNAAIDELRHEKRQVAVSEEEEEDGDWAFAEVEPSRLADPEAALRDKELVELVWSSATALGPEEYSLLDLHVRQGLGADELADSLGVSKGALYTRLSRLKDSLEESVVSTLLMRRGRRDCPELNALLSELGAAEVTRPVRSAIKAHTRECDRCQESQRRYASPLEIFAGLAMLPAAPGLQQSLWQAISGKIGAAAERPARRRRRRLQRAGASGAAMLAGAILLFFLLPVRDPQRVQSTSHQTGVPSTNNVIEIAWSEQSSARAYSFHWSLGARQLPDSILDLPGSATGTRSQPLSPGDWYFSLRTQGRNGRWTSTVHIGPYVIQLPEPTPTVTPPPAIQDWEPTKLPEIVTLTPTFTATATQTRTPTATRTASPLPASPTDTLAPPTATEAPPTHTPMPPTDTSAPPPSPTPGR